ncbi:MAG: lipopolysaccharide kinase InaA family protein [Porticoccaceae bacterium]
MTRGGSTGAMTPPDITLDALRAAQVGALAPFRLALDDGEFLIGDAIYRHLPGRRLVFGAAWQNRRILVKLFFRARDHARERAGLERLHSRGIRSPALHRLPELPGAWLLATEFLPGAQSLAERLRSRTAAAADADVAATLALLGALHRAELIQADPHLDNFLFSDDIPHVIDGAGIHPARKQNARRANLALFLAQFDPTRDPRLLALLPAYGTPPPDPGKLARAVLRARHRRLRHYRNKCLRTCGEFIAERRWDRLVVRRRDYANPGLDALLTAPEAQLAAGDWLKDGNTASVLRVAAGGAALVVKRYNIKHWRHGLGRAPRRSRAWISWQNANMLALLGIPTPQPLALLEHRFGPLRRTAYLIGAYSPGVPLQDWLRQPRLRQPGDAAVPDWLDRALRDILAALGTACISHGDLKASNFLVDDTDRRVQLIDLDAMRLHRCGRRFRRARRRDLARFLANWDGTIRRHFENLLAPLRAGVRPEQ